MAQNSNSLVHKKGQAYFFWGWNGSVYSKSDISFAGQDYNFKLYDVVAHDRQTYPIALNPYLKPGAMTVPQTNFKLGYFIKDNLAINAGLDHMKYVMLQNQVVKMVGSIDHDGKYKGTYNGPQELTEDLLTFEHTDGLNYINTELEKFGMIYQSKSKKVVLSYLWGGGLGVLLPKTNVKLLNYERNDQFHLSGFGVNIKAGLHAVFLKYLFVRIEGKAGYINMPDIILHKSGIIGRAKQNFYFGEFDGGIGFTCHLTGNRNSQKSHQPANNSKND